MKTNIKNKNKNIFLIINYKFQFNKLLGYFLNIKKECNKIYFFLHIYIL